MFDVGFAMPPNRPLYEACYFSNWKNLRLTGLVVDSLQATEFGRSGRSVIVRSRHFPILSSLFRTVASPTKYIVDEGLLNHADAILSVEIYSFISNQFSQYARRVGAKFIALVWETISSHPFYTIPPFANNARSVAKASDSFIATTKRAALHLQRLGISEDRITLIYPGVDTSVYGPDLVKRRSVSKERILYVGLLAKHKGFDLLLRAYKEILPRYDVELLVVGDGPLRVLLSTDLGKGVTYFGRVSQSRLLELYSSSSIFVTLPQTVRHFGIKTWEEQFGFTLVEAMASGMAILASDCGAVSEVVGSQNLIVPERSLGKVVEALSYLLERAKEVRRVGSDNRRRAEAMFDARVQSRLFEQHILSKISNTA